MRRATAAAAALCALLCGAVGARGGRGEGDRGKKLYRRAAHESVYGSKARAHDFVRLAAEAGHAEAQVNHGQHLRKQGDFEGAILWFRHAAEKQGDREAEFLLASAYDLGEGVGKDSAEAIKWYLSSARKGLVSAQVILGSFFEEGLDIDQDMQKAFMWFGRAADQGSDQGDAYAMYRLGVYYKFALGGVGHDQEAACKWFHRAFTKDSGSAGKYGDNQAVRPSFQAQQHTLAECYRSGTGVHKDLQAALTWMTRAAKGGDLDASGKIKGIREELSAERWRAATYVFAALFWLLVMLRSSQRLGCQRRRSARRRGGAGALCDSLTAAQLVVLSLARRLTRCCCKAADTAGAACAWCASLPAIAVSAASTTAAACAECIGRAARTARETLAAYAALCDSIVKTLDKTLAAFVASGVAAADSAIASMVPRRWRTLPPPPANATMGSTDDPWCAAPSPESAPPPESARSSPRAAGDEIDEADDDRICVICQDARRTHIIFPCNHYALCEVCAQSWQTGRLPCPICRSDVTAVKRVFT